MIRLEIIVLYSNRVCGTDESSSAVAVRVSHSNTLQQPQRPITKRYTCTFMRPHKYKTKKMRQYQRRSFLTIRILTFDDRHTVRKKYWKTF
jgi:hypothetical protein